MQEYNLLKQFQSSLKNDLDIISQMLKQKESQYIRVTASIMMLENEMNQYASENGEPKTVNCIPSDEEIEKEINNIR
jgi:hypothetical protein